MSELGAVPLLKAEATEEKSENARMSCFIGAIAIGDLVKSTLGPRGMDKILQSPDLKGETQLTNDGATILKSISIDNPAAKILVDISKVQDDQIGDGTTSVCVFASELLRQAEMLIQKKIHPQTIIAGYRQAVSIARDALVASAIDHSSDEKLFTEDLLNIARTTLGSKLVLHEREHFVDIAKRAVLRLGSTANLDHIHIIKKLGGQLTDSYMDEGFVLEKQIGVGQPQQVKNATILLANTPMDTDKVKIFSTRIRVDSTAELAKMEQAERDKMKAKVALIKAHNINCFVNRQLIYNYPEQLFTQAGIMAIEHADFEGIERLAKAVGGEIVSTFDNPALARLGHCDLIEEITIGEDRMIRFSGLTHPESCTIVIRGSSHQMLQEIERSLHDALCVLARAVKDPRVVYGGGCSDMRMAAAIDRAAADVEGKRSLAMYAFSQALRQIPTIIADNGGFDSAELVSTLRSAYAKGDACMLGLNMTMGTVGDMAQLGITEPLSLKQSVLTSGAECAEMILRVDNIIRTKPRKRTAA